jgi:cellulose biosynthesis protein BcsQ
MAAQIICMASSKGGSGKTVITATLGTFLSAIGKRVLLVDTDASTNGLSLLFLKEVRRQGELAIAAKRRPLGVYELEGNPPSDVVQLGERLGLVPACYRFSEVPQPQAVTFVASLMSLVKTFRNDYDFIFFDAQAGADVYARSCMRRDVSDQVVIVSEYDPMSAAGVERLKAILRDDLTYERTWVLLNKMLPEFASSFSDFLEVAKYLSPIPWDSDVVRAYARRKVPLNIENGNDYTLAILQVVRGLFGESVESELNVWVADRAASIRQPIEKQFSDAEAELEALMKTRHDILRQAERSRSTRSLAATTAIASLIAVAAFLSYRVLGDRVAILSEAVVSLGMGLVSTLLALTAYSILRNSGQTPKSIQILFGGPADTEIELARLHRREAAIEERLRRLTVLTTADADELIRYRARSSTSIGE